ncbi:MAG: hypothetical protein K2X27_26760, partial [Candidatus Obscuribacterales bacterium]|nr:hypothetical protein [Candidatus Obscuribacterales bacterium]
QVSLGLLAFVFSKFPKGSKNMSSVLCIIDMQYPFLGPGDEVYVAAVVEAVIQARSLGKHIVLVEDRAGHPSDGAIKAALEGYLHQSRVSKGQWDGSLPIAIDLQTRGIRPSAIRACGAFAEQCVFATLTGLREEFPWAEIEVLRQACVPAPTGRFNDAAWQRLCSKYRITLN